MPILILEGEFSSGDQPSLGRGNLIYWAVLLCIVAGLVFHRDRSSPVQAGAIQRD